MEDYQKQWFEDEKWFNDGLVAYKYTDFHRWKTRDYLWIIVMFYQLFELSF